MVPNSSFLRELCLGIPNFDGNSVRIYAMGFIIFSLFSISKIPSVLLFVVLL